MPMQRWQALVHASGLRAMLLHWQMSLIAADTTAQILQMPMRSLQGMVDQSRAIAASPRKPVFQKADGRTTLPLRTPTLYLQRAVNQIRLTKVGPQRPALQTNLYHDALPVQTLALSCRWRALSIYMHLVPLSLPLSRKTKYLTGWSLRSLMPTCTANAVQSCPRAALPPYAKPQTIAAAGFHLQTLLAP
eukprot:gnl/MRDRNA2_/MRDRNA2_26978_c0_seq1.p1 gnl/MRDRNA2_/MRDRNA2_26978_c0~~gnl/MRDRNA2_/MRDRNA2_26978_c0_seq1.p1  ORF type:complete len:190 (+),score=23.28 gnl/MRDRNA2_/MRDRNA2_26978_c0_seq1:283-852(+)